MLRQAYHTWDHQWTSPSGPSRAEHYTPDRTWFEPRLRADATPPTPTISPSAISGTEPMSFRSNFASAGDGRPALGSKKFFCCFFCPTPPHAPEVVGPPRTLKTCSRRPRIKKASAHSSPAPRRADHTVTAGADHPRFPAADASLAVASASPMRRRLKHPLADSGPLIRRSICPKLTTKITGRATRAIAGRRLNRGRGWICQTCVPGQHAACTQRLPLGRVLAVDCCPRRSAQAVNRMAGSRLSVGTEINETRRSAPGAQWFDAEFACDG